MCLYIMLKAVPGFSECKCPFMLYSEINGKCRNNQNGKVTLQHSFSCSLDGPFHYAVLMSITNSASEFLSNARLFLTGDATIVKGMALHLLSALSCI